MIKCVDLHPYRDTVTVTVTPTLTQTPRLQMMRTLLMNMSLISAV